MEKFQEFRDTAKAKLRAADHLLTQTYPSIRDPKLLMVVMEGIFSSLANAMTSILHYERTFKRVNALSGNFEHNLEVFAQECINRYSLSQDYISVMRELKNLVSEHKKSPVEFSRKDSFIICSDEYHIKIVTFDQLKRHLAVAKKFLEDAEKILSREEDLFR